MENGLNQKEKLNYLLLDDMEQFLNLLSKISEDKLDSILKRKNLIFEIYEQAANKTVKKSQGLKSFIDYVIEELTKIQTHDEKQKAITIWLENIITFKGLGISHAQFLKKNEDEKYYGKDYQEFCDALPTGRGSLNFSDAPKIVKDSVTFNVFKNLYQYEQTFHFEKAQYSLKAIYENGSVSYATLDLYGLNFDKKLIPNQNIYQDLNGILGIKYLEHLLEINQKKWEEFVKSGSQALEMMDKLNIPIVSQTKSDEILSAEILTMISMASGSSNLDETSLETSEVKQKSLK